MAHKIKKLNCFICSKCRVVLKDDAYVCHRCGAVFYGYMIEYESQKILNKLSQIIKAQD